MKPEKYEPFAEIEIIESPLNEGPLCYRTKTLEARRIIHFNWAE